MSRGPVSRALLAVIRFYQQAISPALPPRCRFYPSCSTYALEAIERHGAGRGSWLALRRILKCAPWHPGGVDLVPEPRTAGRQLRGPRSGTPGVGHSSTTVEAAAAPAGGGARPHRTTAPAERRTPQQEAGVA